MDFIQSLDSSKLMLYGTALSFFLSPISSLAYNFPLFLFGTYTQENSGAIQSMQTLTGLLAASAVFDFISLFRGEYSVWIMFLVILVIALKIPTFLALLNAVRQRGVEFGLGTGGPSLSGPTIWSMPGGFTSTGREGYQTVDDDAFVRSTRPAPPTNQHVPVPQPNTAQPPPPPGAYQIV